MTTEARLTELYAIDKNIVLECEKILQYLQIIKEKSHNAITFLNTLNTSNILRRFSATYEYLNKFYVKLIEQNCSFELLFLDLDELESVTELLSTYTKVKEESVYSETADLATMDSPNLNKPNVQETVIPCSSLSQTSVNSQKSHFKDISSDIINKSQKEDSKSGLCKITMNINAKEFKPRLESKKSFTSFKDDSISVKSNISARNVKNTTNIVNKLREKSISQYNSKDVCNINSPTASHTSSTNYFKNSYRPTFSNTEDSSNDNSSSNKNNANNNVKTVNIKKGKIVTQRNLKSVNNEGDNDKINTSLVTSELREYQNSLQKSASQQPEEKKEDIESQKIQELLHPQIILRTVQDRMDSKYSVSIPDLRPVISKDTDSINTLHSSNLNAKQSAPKIKHITIQSEDDCIHQNIAVKRGPVPKEGDLCYISHVESPSSFYIHVIREENTLIDSLSDQIAEISQRLRSFSSKIDARKVIEKYCVCFINSYSAWCRVAISNWMMDHEQTIEVRLIDYGLLCKVPLQSIREGSQYFFAIPSMADRCKLAMVKPSNNKTEWTPQSISYFNKTLNSTDRLFIISFIGIEEDHFIIDLENTDIESVVGLMISEGLADKDESDDTTQWSNKFMRKQVVKAQGFNSNDFNESESDILESLMREDYDDEILNPHLAVSHYSPKDESEICQIFLKKGYCFKGNNCSYSHKHLNPDGWTTDKQAVHYDAFNQLILPAPGSEICLKVLHIVDLRTFYAIIKNLPECSNLISLPVNNIRALVQLMNDPEEVRTYKSLTVIPAIGEIILVNYNDKWHRGRVFSMDEYVDKVELEVFLVDFGLTKKFNMKNCKTILEKHLHVPFQAVMCTLWNIVLNNDVTNNEIEMGCDYLEMNVENNKLTAKVMYSSNYLNVQLFTKKGEDVGEELVKAGIVAKCTSDNPDTKSVLLVD